MPNGKPRTAIVVGAGAGGIATAARLAKAGFSVTVVEKNGFTGGRCSLIHHGDYRFDQGPSLLLLPDLFRETFHDLGTTIEEQVTLYQCPSNYAIHFSDGQVFHQGTDMTATRRQIEKWEGPGGFGRYLKWMAESHVNYDFAVKQVLHRNYDSYGFITRPGIVTNVHVALPMLESIWSRASKYFKSDYMRRAFTFQTMYMGMSPFDAPSTYSLLQYSEQAEGIFYPKGGFHAVLQALVDIGKSFGVHYRLNTPVRQVLTTPDGKRATGVLLENGETLTADVTIINADLVYAYSNLFPQKLTPSLSPYARELRSKPASCSSISFYWSLKKKVPELSTHNIFLADKYRESFDDIFKRDRVPEDPSFYVNVPSRIDPSASPEGTDAVVVLVPAGHLAHSRGEDADELPGKQELDWPDLVAQSRDRIIATIEARTGCANLKDLIIEESVNTPYDWEERFNLDKGAILGLGHGVFNVLAMRPRTRAKDVKNCFFVGASTHPGTGVPIVLAGAKLTCEQVLQELGEEVPWELNTESWVETLKESDVLLPMLGVLVALVLSVIVMFAIRGTGVGEASRMFLGTSHKILANTS